MPQNRWVAGYLARDKLEGHCHAEESLDHTFEWA